MAGTVRPGGRVPGLAAVAAALLTAAPAAAQPPAAQPPAAGGTTLYLVVRTKAGMPERKVVRTIEDGLRASGMAADGVTPRPVSPLFFEEFDRLVRQKPAADGDTPAPAPAGDRPEAGTVRLAALPTRSAPVTELTLPSPKQTLTRLAVEYQQPGPDGKTAEEYTPKPAGDGPLTLIEPGRYAFRPADGRTPDRYTVTYDERDEATRELVRGKTIEGRWPAADKFYVVTLRNFRGADGGRGDHQRLTDTIKQQNQNEANPVSFEQLGGDQLFVFGDMSRDAATVGVAQAGNSVEFRLPGPVGRTTRRAWVLFPLSEDGYKEAVKRYAEFPTTDLPDEVRKNAAAAAADATVGPDTPARWIEVPADPASPGVFFRRVPLTDVPGLAEKYPSAWQLTVYEFEHPTRTTPAGQPEREAIQVKDPQNRDVSALGSRVSNWSPGK